MSGSQSAAAAAAAVMAPTTVHTLSKVIELKFEVPLDPKWIILGTQFAANLTLSNDRCRHDVRSFVRRQFIRPSVGFARRDDDIDPT